MTTHGKRGYPAFGKICSKCGNEGHFAVGCKVAKSKAVYVVDQGSDTESSDDSLYVNAIKTIGKSWSETLNINGIPIEVKLDSGAQTNVLNKATAARLQAKLNNSRTKSLTSYSGHHVKVLGEIEVPCTVRNKTTDVRFMVIPNLMRR